MTSIVIKKKAVSRTRLHLRSVNTSLAKHDASHMAMTVLAYRRGILSWYDCHISTPYLIVAHKRNNVYVDLATKILRKTAIIQKKIVTLSSVVTL